MVLPTDLQPIAASELPRFGRSWHSMQRFPYWPPYPCNWLVNETNVVYYVSPKWGTHVIFVGDWEIDYAQRAAEREALRLAARAASGLEGQYGLESPEDSPLGYSEGTLWLAIGQLTNGVAPLTIHGTVEEVLYEILSKATLTNSGWASEGAVLGATNQDWTVTAVPIEDRTNSLFFRARVWTDCDGLGTPPAWYVQHGLDPLSPGIATQDADQDGLLNREEYLWGSDPQVSEGFSVWVSSPGGYGGIP